MRITEEHLPPFTHIRVTATQPLTSGQVIAYTDDCPADGYAENRVGIVEAFKDNASKAFAEHIDSLTVM